MIIKKDRLLAVFFYERTFVLPGKTKGEETGKHSGITYFFQKKC